VDPRGISLLVVCLISPDGLIRSRWHCYAVVAYLIRVPLFRLKNELIRVEYCYFLCCEYNDIFLGNDL
jgi:hypothetical protein